MAKAKGGTAVATAKNTLPVDWEKQMALAAERYKQVEASTGGGQFLSIRAGVLSFDGAAVKDSTIEAVPLEAVLENAFYVDDFDADNPHPPVCFAFSASMDTLKPGEDASVLEARMAPHPDSAQPQNATCKGCPKNEFGSAERGKGKACKNGRRIALLHGDYLKKTGAIESAPMAFLKVPPTSLGAWATFVKKVANVLEKPFFAVVARVKAQPDPKTQVKVSFDVAAEVPKALMGSIFARHNEAYALLTVPYQAETGKVEKKKAKGGKAAGKAAAGKAAGKTGDKVASPRKKY